MSKKTKIFLSFFFIIIILIIYNEIIPLELIIEIIGSISFILFTILWFYFIYWLIKEDLKPKDDRYHWD